jgi:hypothetical protein
LGKNKTFTKRQWEIEVKKATPQKVLNTLAEVTLMEAEAVLPELEEILQLDSKESEKLLQAFTPLVKGKKADLRKVKRWGKETHPSKNPTRDNKARRSKLSDKEKLKRTERSSKNTLTRSPEKLLRPTESRQRRNSMNA